jgi:flagellin-like hook-associated protein FlgL
MGDWKLRITWKPWKVFLLGMMCMWIIFSMKYFVPREIDGHKNATTDFHPNSTLIAVIGPITLSGDKVFHGKDYPLAKIPEDRRGANTPNYPKPTEEGVPKPPDLDEEGKKTVEIRGPASVEIPTPKEAAAADKQIIEPGENIFSVFKALSNGLKANDTVAIQETLERFDNALEQVVTLRSQVGSRLASLQNTAEGLGKQKIDHSALLSSIEDADSFEVFTDITKNETTLKATLQTSGKLIQPSLLDFLR